MNINEIRPLYLKEIKNGECALALAEEERISLDMALNYDKKDSPEEK